MEVDLRQASGPGGHRRWMRILTPMMILAAGVTIMGGMIMARKKPPRETHQQTGALVDVMVARAADRNVIVEGSGTVRPRYEVVLLPQVTGKVEWVHPNLVAGGAFSGGEDLLRIEQADYALAVQRAEAQVAQAQLRIEVERANAAIAHREWELMNSGRNPMLGDNARKAAEPDPLVLRVPQLREAEAALAAARAALATAELNLSRTILQAPFNCRVRQENVAPGQLIGPTAQIAVLYGTDLIEIEVGVPVDELAWMDVPGAPARVILKTGSAVHGWEGWVDRNVGVVDELGRLTHVVVRVADPFQPRQPGAPELSIGSFVMVEIEGRSITHTIPLPRAALRENSTVWVVAPDSTLVIREVTIVRLTASEALVARGLESGEQVVLTPLSGAATGMRLRPRVQR